MTRAATGAASAPPGPWPNRARQVTIVTPEAFVGKEIARTAADGAARRRLAQLGAKMLTEHCISRWHGNGVTVRNLLTGAGRNPARLGLGDGHHQPQL